MLKAFHNKAQGRDTVAHPGKQMGCDSHPNGVPQVSFLGDEYTISGYLVEPVPGSPTLRHTIPRVRRCASTLGFVVECFQHSKMRDIKTDASGYQRS